MYEIFLVFCTLFTCILTENDTVLVEEEFIIEKNFSVDTNQDLQRGSSHASLRAYDYTLNCGKKGGVWARAYMDRLIGGFRAAEGEFPWQVTLQLKNPSSLIHFCGGAIVNEYWIITAAHCVYLLQPNAISVVAGDYNLYRVEGIEQRRNLAKMIVHPQFHAPSFTNDIALLKLEYPLNLFASRMIAPICIPDQHETFYGYGTVSGWGRMSETGNSPYSLQRLTIPILNKAHCQEGYRALGISKPFNQCQICAGDPKGGKDACQGDSGGPLVCTKQNGKYYLCGIVSWGIGCGRPNFPGLYTQVSCYIDWIRSTLRNN